MFETFLKVASAIALACVIGSCVAQDAAPLFIAGLVIWILFKFAKGLDESD